MQTALLMQGYKPHNANSPQSQSASGNRIYRHWLFVIAYQVLAVAVYLYADQCPFLTSPSKNT